MHPTQAHIEGDPAAARRGPGRSGETRAKLLAAALIEFSLHGFDSVATRTVALRAGVRHPLVHYHFKSKEGLWRAVLAETGGRFLERFNARLEGLRGAPDVVKLRLAQEEFLRFSAANPHFHLLMPWAAGRPGPRLEWLVDEFIQPYFAAVSALIVSAQNSGHYVPGDPRHLQYLFIGAATRIFNVAAEAEAVTGRSPFAADMIEDHVSLCLGLFFREPKPARKPNKFKAAEKPAAGRTA